MNINTKHILRIPLIFQKKNQSYSCYYLKLYSNIKTPTIAQYSFILNQPLPLPTNFHHHPTILINKRFQAKQKNKNKKDTLISKHDLPDPQHVKSNMVLILNNLHTTLESIHGNEITADFFESIPVLVYKQKILIKSLAQVVMVTPRRAEISCYDPGNCKVVMEAVRDVDDMGWNPVVENGVIVVVVARISLETRKALVKKLGRLHEEAKTKLRLVRRSSLDIIKKGKEHRSGSGISEDDAYKVGKEIDVVSDKCIKDLGMMIKKKQEDVMNVGGR